MHPLKMGTLSGTSEIVESMEESDSGVIMDEHSEKHRMLKLGQICSIEDDINKLFEAIDIRHYVRSSVMLQQGGRDSLRKSAMKRPMRPGSFHAYGIGISGTVTLKQALRGLCISQASELAAMKRLTKPESSSRASEAKTIKRLYRPVAVDEAVDSGLSLKEGKCNLLEISLVPEVSTSTISETTSDFGQLAKWELLNQSVHSSKILPEDEIVPLPTHGGHEISMTELEQNGKPTSAHSSSSTHTSEKLPAVDKIVPASAEVFYKSLEPDKVQKAKFLFASSLSGDKAANNCVIKSSRSSQHVIRPIFRNKNFVTKKVKQDLTYVPGSSNQRNGVDNDLAPEDMEKLSQVSSNKNISNKVSSSAMDSHPSHPDLNSSSHNRSKTLVSKTGETSRSQESEESTLSDSICCDYRTHMSKDKRWDAIHHIQKQHGSLGLRHFKILKKLSGEDSDTIYLAELTSTNCLFALKIMKDEFLASRKKMPRAQTGKETLQMLNHPFLPTLFAHFAADKFSCLVMEYCPGEHLHVLQQKQPNKRFSEQAARFYVAEVLLALEYLHMLGIVYQDLKPNNILVREDGHIILSDFDLSLRCAVNAKLLKPSPVVESPKRDPNPCTESSCMPPFCFQPSWQVPCFTPKLISAAAKTQKLKAIPAARACPLSQLLTERTSACSNSVVGTHEYLAPELIKGEGHGSAVDWWTFGIFLYELLYGKTPFKGPGKEDTLSNIVSHSLKFPAGPNVSSHTIDFIRGLLVKEPESRLGSVKGAAEIKQHPFFEDFNWDLIRCGTPTDPPKIL